MKPISIGDVIDNYKVIDIVGSGGMGAVYKIEHLITRRIEAMKLLPPAVSDDPEQVRRFQREIQVQARLHYPNIASLYTAVRHGPSIALVMEFVEGESLQRRLAAGPLPVSLAVDFAIQVLRALAYAHAAGVIHRDVAPANIIITPDLVAKLTDFGLARGDADLRLTNSGAPLGSPWYMSPEQVRGTGTLDARTDLYSVGAVLHEMLTGAKLFAVEGAFAVMRAHVEQEPAPPSSLNPKVPAALDAIVRKAVAKDPSQRFTSADDFRLALQDVAAAINPVEAPLIPLPETLAALPAAAPPPRGLPSWRAAMLMALVPASLVAGFYAIRFLPSPARVQASERKPPATRSTQFNVAAPAPPAVALPVQPEVPVVAPPTPPQSAPETAKPAKSAHPRTQLHSSAVRTSTPPPDNTIRVTGQEVQPVQLIPVPETAQPLPQKTDFVEAPQAPPQELLPVPEPAATPRETAPAKPQNTGNRFVRALGKVNPFAKRTAK
jgi:serine/threonine-protein kinase